VSAPVEAAGAPFDQGAAQGVAQASQIRAALRELRARYGPLSWYGARRNARRCSGRPLQRFLPQLHERLRGLAAGAGVGRSALELIESLERAAGVGSAKGAVLEARLDLPEHLREQLALRVSRPDAVGFVSVELVLASGAGCLAGVNERGLAVAVLEERGVSGPSLRSYAQDLLLRAESLEVATAHLRMRASLAGGSGALIALDRGGSGLRLALDAGALSSEPLVHGGAPVHSTLRLDCEACSIAWGQQSASAATA
jgi:hypothetical protein